MPVTVTSQCTTTVDTVFARDIFLLRQQALRVNEQYDVCAEDGQPLVFVERPAHLFRNVLAALAGIFAAIVWLVAMFAASDVAGANATGDVLPLVGLLGFTPVLALVAMALSKKRHVTFYAHADKREPLLEIRQDRKFHLPTATYTLRDAHGATLAHFRKNYLFNVFRKRWDVLNPDGRVSWIAKEDSIIRSLLRRLLGPLFGILRTNFVFEHAGSDRVIGEFKRKLTILDRYVLDLTSDAQRAFDRRVALALGVMLDTGEHR